MRLGYNGKILHVNLTEGTYQVEEPDEIFYRTYMGGGCLGAYYLLNELSPHTDPLGPDNVIVFAASILTGTPLAGFSRHGVATKSPLTNLFLDTEAGGYWGPELKFAGFDAIVVKGKAPEPVYLYINDGEISFRDGRHLWGKFTGDAQEIIRGELDEPKARMLMIGPGGENLVKYACILNESKHANGRGGAGAVMGSKNLKAVVCRGHNKMQFADREKIIEYGKWFSRNYMDNPVTRSGHDFGTADLVSQLMETEDLPTRNFKYGSIEGGEKLSGSHMSETILVKSERCWACPVSCKRVVKTEAPYNVDPYYGGPEYETIGAFGSNLGITNLECVAKANELCNKYGIDTISTGMTISFAIECFENGLLNLEDTDGIKLEYANEMLVLDMIEGIACRKNNLGNLLAEGAKKASEIIGGNSEHFAIHTKGMELALHDPRLKASVGLGYACSPVGGDHVVVEHDTDFDEFAPELFLEQAKPLGILRRLNAQYIGPEKIRNYVYLQNHFSFMDSLTLCALTFAPVRCFTMKHLIEIMDAVTGWENSLWEVMKMGERRVNMAKAFNVREGAGRKDDILPQRMYEYLKKENHEDLCIDKDQFNKAIDLLYEMMNWDKEGKPRRAKLHELDLGWVIEKIY